MRIEHAEIEALLNQTPIFGTLDPGKINRLAGLFIAATFQGGDTVFQIGDPSETMYIVCEGRVSLEVDHKGEPVSFSNLNRGDFFGEEALLEDDPRFYRAVARGEVVLLSLDVDNYLYINEELPGIEEMLEVSVHSRQLSIKLPLPWLSEDEFVHVISRRHPAILWARMFIPVAAGLVAALLAVLLLWLWLPGRPYGWVTLGIGVSIAILWSIWTYFDWRNDYFMLTNKRVVWIEKVSLIYDSRQEAPLRTIMSVGIQKSRIGSLFGYADVVVLTYVGTIRLRDLARAEILASLIESYWHRADDRNRREEAEVMDYKLRQKLGLPMNEEEATRAGITHRLNEVKPEHYKEPGFFEWLFSDFLRLRYELNGAITYRKHWFILVRMAWLPTVLMLLAIVAMVGRLGGALTFLPMTPALVGLSVFMFLDFIWIVYQYADWRNDIFQVTLEQILDIDRKPLGKIRRRSAPLENVLSIEYERRGFWGFLFNFGTVYISVGNTRLTFDYVYNPSEVQQDIFYRMGERLEQVRQFEIESERERISEWIASYHRKTSEFRNQDNDHPNEDDIDFIPDDF